MGVVVKPAKFGKGVFARKDFRKGEVVGIVKGRKYPYKSFPVASESYVMELDANTVLNPSTPFRYLNHACNPNCEMQSDGEHIRIITLKSIKHSQELTIDYGWPAYFAIPCGCGSSICRGFIVAEKELDLVNG